MGAPQIGEAGVTAQPGTPAGQIDVRIHELRQLFDSFDPAPFRERTLDQAAEEYIVESLRELPRGAIAHLVVHLDQTETLEETRTVIADAVHNFFEYRADMARRKLSDLTGAGWKNLFTGLVFLAACTFIANLMSSLHPSTLVSIFREGFIIAGWVAMWRPLEMFLYERWPMKRMIRLYRRLSVIPVSVRLHTPQGAVRAVAERTIG
jgi:hypothetical protein